MLRFLSYIAIVTSIAQVCYGLEIRGARGRATRSRVIVVRDLPDADRPSNPGQGQGQGGGSRAYEQAARAVAYMPIPQDLPVPEDARIISTALSEELYSEDGTRPVFSSPPPAIDFLAMGDANLVIPPDTHGAAGSNHLMVVLNDRIKIQPKTGGSIKKVSLNEFWGLPVESNAFDPKVLYDPYNGRWMTTACSNARSANSELLIGVSLTDDPTGAWKLYYIDADPTNGVWADYPSIGFNKNWIAVQVNMFNVSGDSFNRSHIYLFDKSNLYSGGVGNYTLISTGVIGATQVPAITYDNTLSPLYFFQNWNGNINGVGYCRLYQVTGAVGSEVFSDIDFVSDPNAQPWVSSPPLVNGGFAPQFGSPRLIDCGDARIHNLVYRNGTLWSVHTVFVPVTDPIRTAIQWWQFTTTGTILQRARITDPTATRTNGGNYYAYPTIAVNKDNDVLIGYSRFRSNTYASAAYSFRYASDTANTMRGSTYLKVGEDYYDKDFGTGRVRWGDYSSTVVDPVNDTDFWTIQEYAWPRSGGVSQWSTWWGKIVP